MYSARPATTLRAISGWKFTEKSCDKQLNYRVAPEKRRFRGHLIYHVGLLGILVVFHVLSPAGLLIETFISRFTHTFII